MGSRAEFGWFGIGHDERGTGKLQYGIAQILCGKWKGEEIKNGE